MENEVWGALGALKESLNHLDSKRAPKGSVEFCDFHDFRRPFGTILGLFWHPRDLESRALAEAWCYFLLILRHAPGSPKSIPK